MLKHKFDPAKSFSKENNPNVANIELQELDASQLDQPPLIENQLSMVNSEDAESLIKRHQHLLADDRILKCMFITLCLIAGSGTTFLALWVALLNKILCAQETTDAAYQHCNNTGMFITGAVQGTAMLGVTVAAAAKIGFFRFGQYCVNSAAIQPHSKNNKQPAVKYTIGRRLAALPRLTRNQSSSNV